MLRLVIFGGAIMTGFLAEPFAEGLFGLRDHKGVRVYDDGRILFGCHFIDKEVVVTAGDMVEGGEAFVAKEDGLLIGEVAAYTHIGMAGKGVGEILQGG